MRNKIFRARKSELLLSSFYFFTFLILLNYAFVFLRAIFFGLINIFDENLITHLASSVFFTGKITALAVLLSLPASVILTIFLTLCDGHSLGQFAEKILKFLARVPLLLSGLSIVFWLRDTGETKLMVFILIFIILPRLSLRWFEVARNVKINQLEASLSIGMSFWQVFYYLYIKKCFKDFIRQLIILFISLLGLFTPFLYFVENSSLRERLISFEIFDNTLKDFTYNPVIPVLVLVLLLFSFVNVILDYSDEQYGEWNG